MKFDPQSKQLLSTDATRLLLLVLACLIFTSPIHAQSPVERQKRVLVIYSMRKSAPVTDISERVFQKNLSAGLAGHLDYYNEYIDVVRFPNPQYQSALYDFLRRKYDGQTFDLIITVARQALDFVERYGSELFPGAPVFS